MMRTQVARQVRDDLHKTEASLDVALADAQATLARLVAAKTGLGLTGTMGDAAIARMGESVEALLAARTALRESHMDSYTVLKATNIRGVASAPTLWEEASLDEDLRAA